MTTLALFDNRVAQAFLEKLAEKVTLGLYRKGFTVKKLTFQGDPEDLDLLGAYVEHVGHHYGASPVTAKLEDILNLLGLDADLENAREAALTMVNGTCESNGHYEIIVHLGK